MKPIVERKKVLITVKTYPVLSEKYDELVCTAGITEEGEWIRIYPIPFRKLEYESQYSKYQWIEVETIKNEQDFRVESYKPINYDKLVLGKEISTKQDDSWEKRKQIVFKAPIYTRKTSLIHDAYKENPISLAIFKPTKILSFEIEKTEREWDSEKLQKLIEKSKQVDLFGTGENPFEVVKKLPYKFSYVFLDEEGKKSKLMIEDWEIGTLYWNCLIRHDGDEDKACEDVRKKYFDNFVKTKDIYLFLGTTKEHHAKKAPNPFVIIGVFYPKPKTKYTMDFLD
jgi:hypothetical protein